MTTSTRFPDAADGYSLVRAKKTVESGTLDDVVAFRAALVTRKLAIQSQVNRSRADGCDQEWEVRAVGAIRHCDDWLSQARARLAGDDSAIAEARLNEMLEGGAVIFAFSVVGSDLVVVSKSRRVRV